MTGAGTVAPLLAHFTHVQHSAGILHFLQGPFTPVVVHPTPMNTATASMTNPMPSVFIVASLRRRSAPRRNARIYSADRAAQAISTSAQARQNQRSGVRLSCGGPMAGDSLPSVHRRGAACFWNY